MTIEKVYKRLERIKRDCEVVANELEARGFASQSDGIDEATGKVVEVARAFDLNLD